MKKAYVILKKGFEYDDNIYNESEGGTPNLIVFSKEDAELKVNELNIEELKNCSIREYSYDMEDVLNVEIDEYEKFNESLNTKYGKPKSKHRWDSFENKLHPMANEEEANQYLKMVSISFYEAVETDIDTQSLREKQVSSILDK
jgi:hypothetical protein